MSYGRVNLHRATLYSCSPLYQLNAHTIFIINWFVAQSNPCFEVWLTYHFQEYQEFEGMDISAKWKLFLNKCVKGGFDSRKHPVYIHTAIKNSKKYYEFSGFSIDIIGCTNVFRLAESIYPLVEEQIKKALSQITT